MAELNLNSGLNALRVHAHNPYLMWSLTVSSMKYPWPWPTPEHSVHLMFPAPSISTFTLCELQHASFLLVLKEATVSSVSYHCHMLYFLLELPTAMIFLHLACSSSPDSALMLLLERDLLCPASFFFFSASLSIILFHFFTCSPLWKDLSSTCILVFWIAH